MLFGKADYHEIKAPLSGKVIALADLDDPIFSGKVVGDGIALIPSDGEAVSPISGEVSFIAPTLHTYGIRGYDGVEVLVHLGLNTVKLNGKGFKALVKKGQTVEAGAPLCQMDLEMIRSEGYDPTTPVVITSNTIDMIRRLTFNNGFCVAGKTACMKYALVKK
ncbi:MAG: PTS glucose transporter subunit IIA [Succinivibrio sp.]|nr:PTS glucose transporter subunit IIA [Succinivibrio sp.]